jgi:hypothetical protein
MQPIYRNYTHCRHVRYVESEQYIVRLFATEEAKFGVPVFCNLHNRNHNQPHRFLSTQPQSTSSISPKSHFTSTTNLFSHFVSFNTPNPNPYVTTISLLIPPSSKSSHVVDSTHTLISYNAIITALNQNDDEPCRFEPCSTLLKLFEFLILIEVVVLLHLFLTC